MARTGGIFSEFHKGKNKFGLLVAEKLFIMGKNQSWLAEQCGVSKQYISQIILGKRRPSPEVTQKIADLMKINVEKLRKLVLQAS